MRLNTLSSALNGRFFIISLIAFFAGIFAHLGFAPYNWQWATPLALFVLFALLHHEKITSGKRAFLLGLSFGFGLFISGLRWVHVSLDIFGGLPLFFTLLLMALLALYLAIYPAIVSLLFSKFKQPWPIFNAILFSSAWLVTEYLRGVLLTGFPWLSLGYSQTQGVFSPVASVFGMLGLSGIICLIATLTFYSVKLNKLSIGLLALVIIFASQLSSQQSLIEEDKSINLALIQGNIEQSAKWDSKAMWPTITRYLDLSREHFDSDVIIWPEAAMPAVEAWVQDHLKLMDSAAAFNDSAIITGIIGRVPKDNIAPHLAAKPPTSINNNYYNAIMTVGNDSDSRDISGIYQPNHSNRYYKHQLLPIGEFVPFQSLLRPLAPLFNLPMSSFTRGDWAQPNLTARGFKFAPAICYEIAFGELVRANMKADTDFILTISNDAWFGESIGPHQHMQIAQMRAIELGRPLIRVTNTGITAIVDQHGKIIKQLPQFEEAVLRANIKTVSGETYFYRHGHWPVVILFSSLLIICMLVSYRTNRLHQKIAIINRTYSSPKG